MKNLTKKIILSILTIIFINCILIIKANSQKNLQFNDVKLITTEETVPQGMVWKIENVLPTTKLTSAAAKVPVNHNSIVNESNSTQQIIKINNNNIYVASSDAKSEGHWFNYDYPGTSVASATAYGILNGPIWLPSGTTLAASTGVYAISVIEFIATTP